MERELKECRWQAVQAVIDALTERACVLDDACTVVAANAAWRRCASADALEPVGSSYADACHAVDGMCAEHLNRFTPAATRLLASEADEACVDSRSEADGEARGLRVTATRVGLEGKTYLLVRHQDVPGSTTADAAARASTAELEERLASCRQELKQMHAEMEAFTYSVSHDLQGPARRARHFCTLISEDRENVLSQRAAHCLERVEANAEHMLQIIQGLLVLSRVGQQALARSSCDLTAIAEEVVDALRTRMPHLKTEITIAPDLQADADPQLIRIVLDHLIGNAMKFTAHALKPAVLVGAQSRGERLVFWVRDNGIGFDMKYVDKLFQPFQRLHREDEFGGSGMGLNVVRRIIRRHGGEVWAEAVPGAGASFYFTVAPASMSAASGVEGDAAALMR